VARGEGSSRCHAISLASRAASFGFLCGGRDGGGPTVLYDFEPPFSVRERIRFDEPRVVVTSGNGYAVVAGGCGRLAAAGSHCVLGPSGLARDIVVPSSDGTERMVVLGDGRVGLVLPRGGEGGAPVLLLEAPSHGFARVAIDAGIYRHEIEDALWL